METPLIKRNSLFWEVDPSRIPQVLAENDDWVIVRVFEYGEIEDIHEVIRYYGTDKVQSVLQTSTLKPIATVMAYLFLNVNRYKKYAS